MQKHAPVYRHGKDRHEGKAVLQNNMKKYKEMNCVDKQNLVWKNDLVETVEFENLISQTAQRDDVQWMKHTLPRYHQNG